MKITELTAKTSLEVEDTDLLVIEDAEDTKQITVGELKEFLFSSSNGFEKKVKQLINETLDKVSESLKDAKYELFELKNYAIGAWIGSTSGNIQIVIKDTVEDKWLTMDEILALAPDNDFKVQAYVADVWETAVSYDVKDFNTEHDDPYSVNPTLSDANAGFIKAHFDNFTQNEIAGITIDDIKLVLDGTDEVHYEFVSDPDTFTNAVPYVDVI